MATKSGTSVVSEEPSLDSRVITIVITVNPSTGEPMERRTKPSTDTTKYEDKAFALLKHCLGHYPYHIFRGSPVILVSPYEAIVFNWEILEEEAGKPGDSEHTQQARDDLKLLLKYISGGSSGDAMLDKYFRSREAYVEHNSIKFEDLWTIFPPGTLIYGKPFQDQDQLFVVQDNVSPWPRRDDRPQEYFPWKLKGWVYDWNSSTFERTPFEIPFEQFEGRRPITSLPYYPFKLHPEQHKVAQKLVERGKKFRKLCDAKQGERLFQYSGEAIFRQKGFTGLTESRVMVDYSSYFVYGPTHPRNGPLWPSHDNPECRCSDCQNNNGLTEQYRTRFDSKDYQKKKIWEDEQYMLCPPRVLGYILREKQWAQLQVTSLHEIPRGDQRNAWDSRLQLAEEETKTLLFNLVQSHISTTKTTDNTTENRLEVSDIIPHKGKGLVILLYGPPGVGKTSTAETIANATRKPLFPISVADVGTKARFVESNLSKIFALATSWQAILLIDEADVFLESRGRGASFDTEKNALVSVFLRVLEYYQGIMFLTTNQIAQFDIAIPSRIHIAIKYESLTRTQMEKIFKGFLDELDRKGEIEKYDDIEAWLKEDVYSIKFDGRQIRNIVTSALGLARAEAGRNKDIKAKLKQSHLKAAVNNARAFKSDLVAQWERYKNSQGSMIQ
ncbi:hypothetical protein F4779DRAFT_635471 [Xylariaceae sp. FL0662B]|nr:hypothetical protein F4779DRAFT_635471 [Xylariaceae sp. FL0662B]